MVFNYHVGSVSDELGKVDYVWGAGDIEPGVDNAYYYPFERDQSQNVNPHGQSLSWWQTNHPDWIEYKCDHSTPAYEYGDPNVPLDISNPSVRSFIMQTYINWALSHGYSGVAFDNVSLQNSFGRCGHYNTSGGWVQQYSGQTNDQTYATMVVNWAKDMTSRIHTASPGSTVAINFRYFPSDASDSDALIQAVDMTLDENGWTYFGSGTLTDSAWLTYTQNLTQHVAVSGKGFLQMCRQRVSWSSITNAQVQWCMANYFLVKNNLTYLTITGSDGYGYLQYRPEYAAATIGTPMDTFAQVSGTGLYRRDFTNGLVLVNPSSSSSYTISIPANTYNDLYGYVQGGSITLAPTSGIVLVRR